MACPLYPLALTLYPLALILYPLALILYPLALILYPLALIPLPLLTANQLLKPLVFQHFLKGGVRLCLIPVFRIEFNCLLQVR